MHNVVMTLGDYMGASCMLVLGGGYTVHTEMQKLQVEAPHITVCIPNHVFDVLILRYLSPKNIKMFVLNEADAMLSSGFKDQFVN
ncbi:Eukaryotic initiation factor 4A-I [Galemys pyrenaicus]|uniref:Eukaryotic initiation factor 4A-I n=1 Tax=Galemys pyrenaicus TaxID=202257 RepID=A0A8J6DFH9_GALPY|nr:Eukaryotic initiation factor 4A-I [Galemys pyrenaicus]